MGEEVAYLGPWEPFSRKEVVAMTSTQKVTARIVRVILFGLKEMGRLKGGSAACLCARRDRG